MPDNYNQTIIDNDNQPVKTSLWHDGFQIYKKEWWIFWLLSFFVIAVTCGLLCIGLIGSYFTWMVFIFVPLLILPLLFASMGNSYELYKSGGQLTLRGFFSLFGGYYTRKYRQTFHFWKSILWFLVAYIITELVASLIAVLICRSMDATLYNTMINILYASEFPEGISSYEEWLLETNTYNMYIIYAVASEIPAVVIGVATFLYNICKHSVSTYYRIDHQQTAARTISDIFSFTLRQNGSAYRRDLWTFIGPLLGVFTAGFCAVFIPLICVSPTISYSTYMVYGLIGGFALLFLFMPFFMPVTIAMNERWENGYQNATFQYNQMMYDRLNAQAMYTEAQKRAMEEEMRKNGQDPNNTVNNDDQNNDNNTDNGDDNYNDYSDYFR